MDLWNKMGTVEPGRHAHTIGRVLYDHSHKLGKEAVDLLTQVSTYLESLALAQLKQEIEAQPWIQSVLGTRHDTALRSEDGKRDE